MTDNNAPQVPEWAGSKLTNAQFLAYATDVARIAGTFPEGPIPIAAHVSALNAQITKLTDFVMESRKSAVTAAVAAADARRDTLFRAVWNFVDIAGTLEGDDEYSTAARIVQSVFSPYKGAYKRSLTQETAEINGLKHDMEKDEAITAAMALGLTKPLEALYAANDALDAAYSRREDDKAAGAVTRDGDTTESVRKDTLNALFDLIRTVNAMMQLAKGSAALKEAVIRLITSVEQHKRVASQGGKHPQTPDEGGDDEGGGSDEGGETPETAQ